MPNGGVARSMLCLDRDNTTVFNEPFETGYLHITGGLVGGYGLTFRGFDRECRKLSPAAKIRPINCSLYSDILVLGADASRRRGQFEPSDIGRDCEVKGIGPGGRNRKVS